MFTSLSVNLNTKENLINAIKAYQTVSRMSESELETLAILSNQKEKDLILSGIQDSKDNKTHPIESIL